MARYGWIITKDYCTESGVAEAVRILGPSDILPALAQQLITDPTAGQAFRLYDDDGELYYEGRQIGGTGFEALDDFGMPNAGATEVRVQVVEGPAGEWVTL